MHCKRRWPRYYRDREWKPPYDLVIPPQYPAQYTLPASGYNPTPGYHSAPGYYPASNYQYTQGYHPAWSYQPAQGYYGSQNYPLLQSYQPLAAPSHSTRMLPAPSTVASYSTTQPQFQVQPSPCHYGPSYYTPVPYSTFPPRFF